MLGELVSSYSAVDCQSLVDVCRYEIIILKRSVGFVLGGS